MTSDDAEATYLDALLKLLPEEYDPRVSELLQSPSNVALVETMLRLTAGGPCPSSSTPPIRYSWVNTQSRVQQSYQSLNASSSKPPTQPPSRSTSRSASRSHSQPSQIPAQSKSNAQSQKRKRDSNSPAPSVKKPKGGSRSTPPMAQVEGDDPPRYTLYAMSITVPVRKRYDITIHAHTIRFSHPTTHAVEVSYLLSSTRRAFVVPTRGKNKPHWTVIIASHDVAMPPRPNDDMFQIVFGIDAAPVTLFRTEEHPNPPAMHAKHTPTRQFLDAFLAHLPSACSMLEPRLNAGIAAYRGARECTLWLMNEGLLCEGKGSEFWPLEGLMEEENEGDEAVRIISATGRLCSVLVTRKQLEGEADETEAVELSMIDGKAQPEIREWVRTHRRLFGRSAVNNGATEAGGSVGSGIDQGEDGEPHDSDDDDSDFEVSSGQYDGGSPSSSSSSDEDKNEKRVSGKQISQRANGTTSDAESESVNSEDGGSDEDEDGGGEDAEGEGEEGDEEEDDDAEEASLDPKKHPLMRPGAVPKMSRAAMDAAVSMVVGDMLGRAVDDEDEDDELDE